MSYPFSDKSLLTLGVGLNEEIKEGDAVIFEKTLIGKIENSLEKYSVFKTVFDPHWEFPVYIGSNLARGLFKGGTEPKIVLISKKNKIEEGDLIISADPKSLPKNIVIGTVGVVESDESNPFWEVIVNIPYNLNQVREVSIIKI